MRLERNRWMRKKTKKNWNEKKTKKREDGLVGFFFFFLITIIVVHNKLKITKVF